MRTANFWRCSYGSNSRQSFGIFTVAIRYNANNNWIISIVRTYFYLTCLQIYYEGVLISPSPNYFPMSYDGIVGKRGLFMCRNGSLSFLQRLKGSMSGDARDFNNLETRAVINFFFCKARPEGNSHHSNRNIRGTCTIVCHRKKLGGPV